MYIKFVKIIDNKFDKIYEVILTLKSKKLKVNNILIEKNKIMLEFPDFEQNHYSITSTGIYRIGHDSIRLMKRICYYDRSYYEKINFYDLMGSICNHLNEISKR